MSVLRAVAVVWRNLIEGRALDLPRYEVAQEPSPEAEAKQVLRATSEALVRSFLPRLPEHLQSTLEHVIMRSNIPPTDRLSLMNSVSEWRAGLGVANERGGVPSEADRLLYQRLGELERWLDHELGHPEGTHYAVVRRAVEQSEQNERNSQSAA